MAVTVHTVNGADEWPESHGWYTDDTSGMLTIYHETSRDDEFIIAEYANGFWTRVSRPAPKPESITAEEKSV